MIAKYFIIGTDPTGEMFVAAETATEEKAILLRDEMEKCDGTGWQFRVVGNRYNTYRMFWDKKKGLPV